MPEETRELFECAARQTAVVATSQSEWGEFASGLAALESVPDPPLREVLHTAAKRKMERVEDLVFRDLDLIQAVAGLDCIRQLRPDLWTEFAHGIEDRLPPERSWPKDYRLLVAGRILLNAMRSPSVPAAEAERWLREFAPLPQRTKLSKAEPKAIYLFLWNLFALWHERGGPIADRFDGLQRKEFWDQLIEILHRRAQKRASDEDSLALFALAGTLAFLVPLSPDRVRTAIERKRRESRRLLDGVSELTMVPAFFALHGLALLYGPAECFPPLRRRWLVERSKEYEERGPAIEYLCDWLRKPQVNRH